MPGRLIFTLTPERRDTLAELGATAFTPSNIIGVQKHLRDGGVAIITMTPFSVTGYRVPEGTTIEFDEEVPEDHPLRAQAESRVSRVADAIAKSHEFTVNKGGMVLAPIPENAFRNTGVSEISITLTDGTEAKIPCSEIELGYGDPYSKILAAAIHHLMQRVETLEDALGENT